MSQASFDSESGEMFGSEEFGSGFDSGLGLGNDGGFVEQAADDAEFAQVPPAAPVLPPVKQKGFTLDSFLLLLSMLLMMASAIILFSYLGSIEV